MPRKQLTLIAALALILLLLLGGITYLENRDATDADARVLMDSNEIRSISIQTERPTVMLEKRQTQWWMNEPVEQRADNDRIGPLLALLQLPQRQSYTIDEVNRAELGLSTPFAIISLNKLEFRFGALAIDNNSRYVQVGERVYLYNEMAYPLINAGYQALLAQP